MKYLFPIVLAFLLSSCASEEHVSVEVFSWWTSGSEAAAMRTVFDAFAAEYPDIPIVDASIAGGGGSAARPVLQTRLVGGNPPDTWQTHHGAEVMGQYVEPGFAAPLHDLYVEQGWYDVFPETLVDEVSKDGAPYMVLLNLHRSNTLWYNKPLLRSHGIEIGESLSHEELFEIAGALAQTGLSPLCMGDSGIWANGIMFENTLLGILGPERYLGLWDGSVGFDDPVVLEAVDTYSRLLDYLNSDHAALSWDQAVDKLVEGRCAFYSMGDWVYGELAQAGLTDNVDFGWVAHPGTEDAFLVVSDGFTLARNAPHRQEALSILRIIGRREVQENFNLKKGAICARTDCDRSRFGAYLNWSMDSYTTDTIVPTVVHGSAAPAHFQQVLNDALTMFVVDRNAEALVRTLGQAAAMSGIGASAAIYP